MFIATPIKKFVPKMNASKALEVMMLDSTDEEDEELESDEDFVDFNQLKQVDNCLEVFYVRLKQLCFKHF